MIIKEITLTENIGVASGRCGVSTLRKPQKPNPQL